VPNAAPTLRVALLVANACLATSALAAADQASPSADAALSPDNPFAQPSALAFEYPPFDRMRDTDFRPAFMAGMAAQLQQAAAIANDPQPPSFDNTIVALERSGGLLTRVARIFFNLSSSNSDPAILQLETELAPELAAHQDAIHLDPVLFARIDSLYAQRATLALDAESRQLLERYYSEFVRAGARLAEPDKAKLRQFNEQLSTLSTQFRQNLLQASRDGAVVVDQVSQLDGLSSEQIDAAAAAAKARDLDGHWLIALENTTTQQVLAQLKNRALRERIYRASSDRARAGATDNTPVIAQMVKLRAQRAQLLGFPTHAAYVLAGNTAHDVPTAEKLLRQTGAASLRVARTEAADIQHLIDAQAAANHTPRWRLQPWDWQYYSEQIRQQRYDFDSAQIKPYFELNRVLQDGVFYVAHELYGLSFKERHDLPVYQSDVRVFDVFDADGSPLAIFLADYYARDNKQGGAWMSSYVVQSKLLGLKPVVVNNLNIPKPPPGAPTLLSFDEVTGLFHEFGHALHGMLSNVQYPLLAGTSVPRDFVEYPSQFNEMWSRDPAVVAHFARHYQSGEPLPQTVLDKVVSAQKFNQGYTTSEYIEAALLDLAWHEITPAQAPLAGQVMGFEAAALKARGVDYPPVPPRYHSPYFLHIFSNDYSAGYYAYLWSEVLARDTGQWLYANGGLTRANGDILRAKILSRGRTEEPQDLFREFYGKPPDVGPLLEYHGLR
jgi:peptidyl-dipeptidase Dcp